MSEREEPATAEEQAAATALAEALEGAASDGESADLAAAETIRAAAGHAPPLGELAARRIARAAIAQAMPQRRRGVERRGLLVGLAAIAATVALFITLPPHRGDELAWPAGLRSRSAGRLVPGPFPAQQGAAARLDLVTQDRLIAYREVRLRRLARGAR